MLFYKFTDPRGLKILSRLELKVTPPSKFNDPFEFTPRVDTGLSTSERVRQKLIQGSKTLYSRALKNGLFKGTLKEFAERILQDDNLQIASKTADELSRKLRPKNLRYISRNWAVTCLSERFDSLLMWSHYTDGHRGIVFGIDMGDFLTSKEDAIKVRYTKKPAKWHLLEKKTLVGVTKTKWQGWKYEKEWRFLFDLKKCQSRKSKRGNYYFVKLASHQIKEIILGQRCAPLLQKRVGQLLRTKKMRHVKCLKAELDKSEFKLNFVPFLQNKTL